MLRKEIREAIEEMGLPGEDLHNLPTSTKTFPDGANWRVEISGIESSEILKATIDEAKKQNVPFHRAISLVRGSSLYTPRQLEEFALIAMDNGVEVIVTPGPRPTFYTGRQIATPEGALSGFDMRGMDSIADYFEDVFRCIDIGFKGFLVWDVGVLWMTQEFKKQRKIPEDITFKFSIFGGCANPAKAAKILKEFGAGTINPVADLSLPMLAAIRKAISDLPMDIHIQLWRSMGGYDRTYETPRIARIASPCYFKMEPGPGFEMYAPWNEAGLADLARKKIRSIKVIYNLIKKNNPELKVSGSKWLQDEKEALWLDTETPKDLRIPKYKYAGLKE